MMPMDPERQKLCDDLRLAIADEREGVELYKRIESRLNQSDNPAVRALGSVAWMIKEDEEKHKNVLEKINWALCRTF